MDGVHIIRDNSRNKGTAFTDRERDEKHIRGLMPVKVYTQQEQIQLVWENFQRKQPAIEKYIYLNDLQNDNEALFYASIAAHIEEMMPVVYTPVVGQGCQMYSHIMMRPKGMYIGIQDAGRVQQIVDNWPAEHVDCIVVTDGERILGLGDLGANGMGIPVGKLALYTACAGVNPKVCLPVSLDVGTNTKQYLEDPLYCGNRFQRVRGEPFFKFVDEFIVAVNKRWPGILVQFEDFHNVTAFDLLQHYRNKICTFNDDIQGTACVALAGIITAMRITKGKLADQKFLFLGAGEAAVGIADLIAAWMLTQGLTMEHAKKVCMFLDSKAVVNKERKDLQHHKIPWAGDFPSYTNLLDCVKFFHPTALIGVSATPKTFTKEIVEEMAKINERPIIFALSNPTSKAECSAEEAYTWSDGRAVFASGSPFPQFTYKGEVHTSGQANNAWVFPGIGLGLVVGKAKHVTDEMFLAAAEAVCERTTEEHLKEGCIFPPLTMIREVSAYVAAAVNEKAISQGLAVRPAGVNTHEEMVAYMKKHQYDPSY